MVCLHHVVNKRYVGEWSISSGLWIWRKVHFGLLEWKVRRKPLKNLWVSLADKLLKAWMLSWYRWLPEDQEVGGEGAEWHRCGLLNIRFRQGGKRAAAKEGERFHKDGIFPLYLLLYVVMLITVSFWLFFCSIFSYRCILCHLFAIHLTMYFDCICVVLKIKSMSACEHTIRLWEIFSFLWSMCVVQSLLWL